MKPKQKVKVSDPQKQKAAKRTAINQSPKIEEKNKTTRLIISYILVNSKPVIRTVYKLTRVEITMNGKTTGMRSYTEPLSAKGLKKLAHKIKCAVIQPEPKVITVVVDKNIKRIESARWSYDNKGGDLTGKDIVKAGKDLVGFSMRIAK